MTINTSHFDESNSRRMQQNNLGFDIFIVLVVGIVLLGIMVMHMNMQRQISNVEDSISAIEKSNGEVRSLLANQRRRRDALQSKKVVIFARERKMTMPSPGQVCVITRRERGQVPTLPVIAGREHEVASMPAPFLSYEVR